MTPRKKIISYVILTLVLVSGIFLFTKSKSPALFPQANIVFIVVDTLRADYVGAYGFEGDISPTIDQLAKESVLFEKTITQAPRTDPSMASIFTSQYPPVVLMTRNRKEIVHVGAIPEEKVTLAEILKEKGYTTIGSVGNIWLLKKFGFSQGFDHYFEPKDPSVGGVHEAETIFEKVKPVMNKARDPFFLYLHFMDVHGPYQCSEEDFKTLSNNPLLGEGVKLRNQDFETMHPYIGKWIKWLTPQNRLKLQTWRGCYAAGVRNFDRKLKGILAWLKEEGHLENSILVLTSDHGEELFDHKGWMHGYSLQFHQIDVPLLIKFPNNDHAGKRLSGLTRSLDITPTLLSAVGIQPSAYDFEGKNLLPYLRKSRQQKGQLGFSGFVNYKPSVHSVQTNEVKLIWDYPFKPPVVYDLIKDPRETTNIFQEKKFSHLEKDLIKHIKRIEKIVSVQEKSNEIPADVQEGLKSLGYLN